MKGKKYKGKGWFGESNRHYLAAKGIKTGRYRAHKRGFENGLPANAVVRSMALGAGMKTEEDEKDRPFLGLANAIEGSFKMAAGKDDDMMEMRQRRMFARKDGAAFSSAMSLGAGVIPTGEGQEEEQEMTLNFIPDSEEEIGQDMAHPQQQQAMVEEEEQSNPFFAGKQNTMFGPPKNQKVADMVSLEDPESAKESAQAIINDFDRLEHEDAMRHRIRATTLAANRARAQLERENLSKKEQEEFEKIAEIYDSTQQTLSNRFDELKNNGMMAK